MARGHPSVVSALRECFSSRRSSRVLIGLSGGRDSVALFHACLALRREFDISCEAAHIDHALRTRSAQDAEFVRGLCASHGVVCHSIRLEPPVSGVNLEQWGRSARYRFYREVRERRNLDYVLTAHTANDVAETLLMRLLSNKEPLSIASSDPSRHLLRPLLLVERSAINSYLDEIGATFVEDESNADVRMLRNRVRHVLIPELEAHFGRNVVESLSRQAQRLHADLSFLRDSVAGLAHGLERLEFGSRQWVHDLEKTLADCAPPLRWRLIAQIFSKKLHFRMGHMHADRVVRFFQKRLPRVTLPGGTVIARSQGKISLEQGSKNSL